MTKLPEYLTRKYLGWQTEEGERKTLEEFANYLGVNRSLLSFWMNGTRVPNEDNADKMAEILGNEIYDVLGMPRPNPYLQRINRVWEFLPDDVQQQIANEAEKYEAQNEDRLIQQVAKQRKKKKA